MTGRWFPLLQLATLAPASLLAGEGDEGGDVGAGASEMGAGAPDIMTTALTLGLGLVVVVILILLSGWLVRRVQGVGGVNSQSLKVVSVLSVGQKERVALIEIAEKQILIGVTPQSVRTLHVFDEPVVTSSQPAAGGDFARKLQQVLGRGTAPTGGSNDS